MDPRFAAAEAALKANREEEGLALLTAALTAGPGPASAYKVLTTRLVQSRRYAEAEPWLKAGLERAPRDLDMWNMLGVSLRRMNRLDEALAALERAHKLDPRT